MPHLEACYEGESAGANRHWRKVLPLDLEVTLGRIHKSHPDPSIKAWNKSDWEIPESTDNYVSGCHAILKWVSFEGKLHVRRRMRPEATANPIVYNNRPTDIFTIFPGESFTIGKHKFILHDADTIDPADDLVPAESVNNELNRPAPPEPPRFPAAPPVVPAPPVAPPPAPVAPPPAPLVVEKPKRPSEQNQVAPKASSSSAKAEAAPLDRLDEGVHVSMSPEAIQDQDFVNAQARLKALTRLIDLPKKGIQVDELERNLVQLILDALPNATGVAIVQLTPDCTAQNPECRVRRAWKRREGNVPRYSVSNRLAYNVIRRRPECRLQLWFRGTDSDSNNQNNGGNFTVIGNGIDWTICCPLMSEYTQDLGIYVDGELPRNINKNALDTFEREELHDYQKFVEQAARILTNVRMVRALEKQTKQLSQFVPPMVLMAMKRMDIQTLFAPKAVPVSVLFCDLRSSCKVAEDAVTPEVLNALGTRIREALGVMTQAISTNDGVVGDLQGDAAMGFWGWPIDQPDQIDRAARAALEIRNRFFNRGALHRGDNSDLKCGIGMAHGLALAGAMGTSEHIKSDVFGPVVNLAARLEGMTKALGAPILVDETIGNYLRNYKPNQIAAPRARLMGRFLPAGMTKPVIVYELLPPEGARGDQMPENSRRLWEVAVEDFMSGNWSESRQKLDDFILQHSGSVDHSGTTMLSTRPEELKAAYLMLDFMQKNNYTVPISLQYWRANGAIDLPK